MDFSKAFDSVSHVGLVNKLISHGISGTFIQIVLSLYSKVKSCVKGNTESTELFPYSREVRQGCILSPLLFALFINDLNKK